LVAFSQAARFPWLCLDGIARGALGVANEGWFDPWQLLSYFKVGALGGGARYLHGDVRGIRRTGGRVSEVDVATPDGGMRTLSVDYLVVAAGPWSARVTEAAGVDPVPVAPRRRCVFSFSCAPDVVRDCPLVVDPSGQYFRREANSTCRFITGVSPPPEADPDEWGDNGGRPPEVDHALWEGLWAGAAARVPHFEAVKATGSWAGYYEYNTVDQNGIIGRHTECENLLLACGFSGHGVQQSPAVGRAVSELILHGEYRTIQLDRFGFGRFKRNELVVEENVV
jgi:FAD-dependent oxidoreductase domain-containing protein 1